MPEICIPAFDTSRHEYLTLRKKGGEWRIATEKRSWLGRLLMKLGWHPGSMLRIIHFLSEKKEEKYTIAGEGYSLLCEKLTHYRGNHRKSFQHNKIRNKISFLFTSSIESSDSVEKNRNTSTQESEEGKEIVVKKNLAEEKEQLPSASPPTVSTTLVQKPEGEKNLDLVRGGAKEERKETIEKATRVIREFATKGLFPRRMWALATKGPIVNNRGESISVPDSSLLLTDFYTYQDKLMKWVSVIKEIEEECSDREGKQWVNEIVKKLCDLQAYLQLRLYLTDEDKEYCVKEYLEQDKQGSLSVYKVLETRMRGKEATLIKSMINTMQEMFVMAGNDREERETLQIGLENLRKYCVYRKPRMEESLRNGNFGSAEAIFNFLVCEFFAIDGSSELKPFEELRLATTPPPENWVNIATICHVSGNHFVNDIRSGALEIRIDNLNTTTQERGGTIVYYLSLRQETFDLLNQGGSVIDPEELCIPKWADNNCYLSAAFVAFAVMVEYAKRAKIFNPATF